MSPRLWSSIRSVLLAQNTYVAGTSLRDSTVRCYSVPTYQAAVIGSGPAGFYTAYRLLEKLPGVQVDMYEALPVPYGLSRFGVAPDHPEVKNCQEKFDEVGKNPNFRYIGNVKVGYDISLSVLKKHYNGVILSYGSSEDRPLGVTGENSPGVFSAREFVGWYNGLPEHADLNPPLDQAEDVVIVGNGNVALDVARILACNPDRMKSTDIMEHAYDTLKASRIKNIRIIARRGVLQSAFTIKEIRELIREPGVVMDPIDDAYFHPWKTFIPILARPKKRLLQLLETIANENTKKEHSDSDRTVRLDYLLSPEKFIADPVNTNLLSSSKFRINKLIQDDIQSPATVISTQDTVSYKSELAFKSVGYKAMALPGFDDLDIPFDHNRGLIPNQFGRVGSGIYVAGWVKNGPTGVIAETMRESFEVAETIIADYYENQVDKTSKSGYEAVRPVIGSRVVSWNDWQTIDRVEQERGKIKGKPREKFASVSEMLAILDN